MITQVLDNNGYVTLVDDSGQSTNLPKEQLRVTNNDIFTLLYIDVRLLASIDPQKLTSPSGQTPAQLRDYISGLLNVRYTNTNPIPSSIVVSGAATSNTNPLPVVGSQFYSESTTPLATNATFTGTTRDVGVSASVNATWKNFNAFVFSDQTGTMRIETSIDNITWRRATSDISISANSPLSSSVVITARYYRVVFVNGTTAQTAFMLNTSFTN